MLLCAHIIVVFVLGTRFYVILKPKREAARLFLDIPACIAVSIICMYMYMCIILYILYIYEYCLYIIMCGMHAHVYVYTCM